METEYEAALRRDGFAVVPSVLGAPDVADVRAAADALLAEARRDPTRKAGGTAHLDNLTGVEPFARVERSAALLGAVRAILGPSARVDRVHYRAPKPGFGAQVLHADWNEPIVPHEEQVATAIVALVDFTEAGGATRVVPGSHVLPRVAVPDNPAIAFPGERIVTCKAGDAIVFSGHLRHSGTQNRAGLRRDSLQITFGR